MRRQHADRVGHRVEAEHAHRARLGLQQAEDVLDERRLAGAVAADQAEHDAARARASETSSRRDLVAEPPRDAVDLDDRGAIDVRLGIMAIMFSLGWWSAWPASRCRISSSTSSSAMSICRASASRASTRSRENFHPLAAGQAASRVGDVSARRCAA